MSHTTPSFTPTAMVPGHRYVADFFDPAGGVTFPLEFVAGGALSQPHPAGVERVLVAEFDGANLPELVVTGSIRKVA